MTKKKKTSPFLRNCIFEALILLLDTKKYEDITVSELAERAGVSRMTYYRTYANKEDIVVQFLKERTDVLITKFEEQEFSREQWYLYFFTEVSKNQEVADKIIQTPALCTAALQHFTDFAKYILHGIYGMDSEDPQILYKIMYLTGGFIFVVARWVHHGCQQSPEEMTRLVLSYQNDPYFVQPK